MITRRRAILIVAVLLIAIFIAYFIYVKYYRVNRVNNKGLEYFRGLIEEVVEVIIPKTDTPGAKDANVADYIVNILENCTNRRDRDIILNGLEDLEMYSVENFSASFEKCSLENKRIVLEYFETKGVFSNSLLNKIKRKVLGKSFFEQIKWLTVSGYCQSKLGATRGLAYDHIPVNYLSCIPYIPNQKSWATK